MGKIRNCRLTPEKKYIHKRAVSLRNLNDEELVGLVDKSQPIKRELRKERTYAVAAFIEAIATIPGIGQTTLEKIRAYAEEEHYIEPEQADSRKAE